MSRKGTCGRQDVVCVRICLLLLTSGLKRKAQPRIVHFEPDVQLTRSGVQNSYASNICSSRTKNPFNWSRPAHKQFLLRSKPPTQKTPQYLPNQPKLILSPLRGKTSASTTISSKTSHKPTSSTFSTSSPSWSPAPPVS